MHWSCGRFEVGACTEVAHLDSSTSTGEPSQSDGRICQYKGTSRSSLSEMTAAGMAIEWHRIRAGSGKPWTITTWLKIKPETRPYRVDSLAGTTKNAPRPSKRCNRFSLYLDLSPSSQAIPWCRVQATLPFNVTASLPGLYCNSLTHSSKRNLASICMHRSPTPSPLRSR